MCYTIIEFAYSVAHTPQSGKGFTQKGAQSCKTATVIMANKRKRHISCLGVLLIFCMLMVVALTAAVNLLFQNGAAPSLLGNHYVYYTEDDMPTKVPKGVLVFVEDTDQISQKDIVLYRNPSDAYRIAVASLIVDTDSSVPDQTGKTYYLTTESNTTAVQVEESSIIGICRRRSKELGMLIGFLSSLAGKIIGFALPLLIILIYLISSVAGKKEMDFNPEDEDNDLAFVKSIQQKQQKIAERDAERIAKERKKTQTFDDAMYEDPEAPSFRPQHRMSDEEIAQMEEEEAARRAERIAAVRSHMEQRRQTETPDGVPLYTTEIITKTHTLSIPKSGDKPLTTTTQRPLKPTPTEDIPRLTATGHIQIPTRHSQELHRTRHSACLTDRSVTSRPRNRKHRQSAMQNPKHLQEDLQNRLRKNLFRQHRLHIPLRLNPQQRQLRYLLRLKQQRRQRKRRLSKRL